jgi:predicted cupin superfamily sugar epimerase
VSGSRGDDQSAADLVKQLALRPHPEGGWFREVYRSATRTATKRGERSALTTIYYLLERIQLSRWHVVEADEVWHFYAGAPLELLEYHPAARQFARHVLGHVDAGDDDESGDCVATIPNGVWQAARSLGEWSLVGCTVAPGFEFDDFQFVTALAGHAEHFRGELAPYAALL